jgi:hypothetical protein
MIYVGLDDTDMPDTPGTNKLAMYLADLLADDYHTQWIVRHQMLVDSRVPCTRMNGSVSLALESRSSESLETLAERIRHVMFDWCPVGSDPGLCLATSVAPAVQQWGKRAQAELLEQSEALQIAREHGVILEPLGGTGGGVIGALAAVGLLSTGNSGRIVRCGRVSSQAFDVTGRLDVQDVLARGVDRVVRVDNAQPVESGTIVLGKKLRPNLRCGQVVLYVLPSDSTAAVWQAQRVVA